MTCEDMELLISVYLDGEATDEERQLVEQHLAGCRSCQATCSDFSDLHRMLGEIVLQEAAPGFRQRVTQRIDSAPRFRFARFQLRVPRVVYALCVSLLLVLGGTVFSLYVRDDHPILFQNEPQAAVEIEVYAEDFLFGERAFEDMDVFSTVGNETSIGDELWDTMNLSETETFLFDEGQRLSLRRGYHS